MKNEKNFLGECTPELLLTSLGTNPTAPFKIDMHYVKGESPSGITPMNEESLACNESCSCQDCIEACRNPGIYPSAMGSKCLIGQWDCFHFISALMLLSFFISVLVFCCVHKVVIGTPLPEGIVNIEKDTEMSDSQMHIRWIDLIRLKFESGLQ